MGIKANGTLFLILKIDPIEAIIQSRNGKIENSTHFLLHYRGKYYDSVQGELESYNKRK